MPRDPYDHRWGPRLPSSPPRHGAECVRCGENDGRRLHRYDLVNPRTRRVMARIAFCGECVVAMFPMPDPDPLTVIDAA